MKTHINALLKLRLQLLHQRLVSKSHSKCNFILNWPGKVTHVTQTNKKSQHTEAKKKNKKTCEFPLFTVKSVRLVKTNCQFWIQFF